MGHAEIGTTEFQSTLPRGERRPSPALPPTATRFQSTLPRGERRQVYEEAHSQKTISIHAPAWGATKEKKIKFRRKKFQSTLPRGERR